MNEWPINNHYETNFMDLKYCFKDEEIGSKKWLAQSHYAN